MNDMKKSNPFNNKKQNNTSNTSNRSRDNDKLPFDTKKAIGDVPGYLVFLITYLLALVGTTFYGGHFLLMRNTISPVPATSCDAKVEPTDSNNTKWAAWAYMVFNSSITQSYIIWDKLARLLKMAPELAIFYGLSIALMFIIPVVIYPLAMVLVIIASVQKCPGFKDSIHYAIPPIYFYQFCDRRNEVWNYANPFTTFVFKTIPWVFHMIFHLCQSFAYFIMNIIVWSITSSISSFTILGGLFITPFFKTTQIFEEMNKFSMSLSALVLFIVLYGAYRYLSVYVFLGFCAATLLIVFREIKAELSKPMPKTEPKPVK